MKKPAGATEYFHQVALKAAVDAIPPLKEEKFLIWQDTVLILINLKDIKDKITRNLGQFSIKKDREIRAVILSKLDNTTHTNVVNSTNIN